MGTVSVALQLYTVRDFAEKDLEDTLRRVKEMGYDAIELAGMYGREPAAFRKALDESGITAVSAHVPINELDDDVEKTVADYKTVGCRYIAIPWLHTDFCPDGPQFNKTLEIIRKAGSVCNDNGITLLYHNHDFEFRKMPDGTFGLDHLFNSVPADILQTELDTCWIKVAGQDPAAYVKKYAGRIPVVHLKDYHKEGETDRAYELIGGQEKTGEDKKRTPGKFEFRPVGYGCQDFPPIIEAAAAGGAKWIVVEQDRSEGRTSLEAARLGREYLKSLGY